VEGWRARKGSWGKTGGVRRGVCGVEGDIPQLQISPTLGLAKARRPVGRWSLVVGRRGSGGRLGSSLVCACGQSTGCRCARWEHGKRSGGRGSVHVLGWQCVSIDADGGCQSQYYSHLISSHPIPSSNMTFGRCKPSSKSAGYASGQQIIHPIFILASEPCCGWAGYLEQVGRLPSPRAL
jgi:hypothetical protein